MKLFLLVITMILVYNVYCHQNHQGGGYQPPPNNDIHHQQQQQHHQQFEHKDPVRSNINQEHVMEHLDGVINKPKEHMTPEEQNFYYFKLHDYDNNNKLDGLELVSAFAHNEEHKDEDTHHDNHNKTETPQTVPRISDDDLIKLIDEIMKDEDRDSDGYITYHEFIQAINK